jgi:hypothetical protein
MISAKPGIEQQTQFVETACVQPTFDATERSFDQNRDRNRGARDLDQWVQLECYRFMPEIDLPDSGQG